MRATPKTKSSRRTRIRAHPTAGVFSYPQEARLILEDSTIFEGQSFGFPGSVAGEVVFNTGMVGYVESLTDPSYAGQILVLTYPLIGNYGVSDRRNFESEKIQVAGLVVSEYSANYSHHTALQSLGSWLSAHRVPALTGVDTRALTKRLRARGVMLGQIVNGTDAPPGFTDPNKENLVAKVSCRRPRTYPPSPKATARQGRTVVAIDCGMKENIVRSLVARGVAVKRVPWDYDFTTEPFDGLVISNGPGDPIMCQATISHIKKTMALGKPILGICLGNQLLALAAGATTYKLKYGHRSQNQPCRLKGTERCYITSQNHGFSVNQASLPRDWQVWFENANDHTVEGVRHKTKPWAAVQFHPEAAPGPTDTSWIFDDFVRQL